MKQSKWLAFTAAVLMSAISVTGYAAQTSAPTYNDDLILKQPVHETTASSVVLVPVASPQAVAAIHDYVMAWQNANEHIAVAKAKLENNEKLTKADVKWLHSMDKHNYADYFRTHSLGRVHGYEVAMNWNGENRNVNDYEFFSMPKYDKKDGFTNSYGFNVLRGMVDEMNTIVAEQKQVGGPQTVADAEALEQALLAVMAKDQEQVSNEELRHYMNETVWFAAKETVKNKSTDEPKGTENHVVDLRKAIETAQ